MTVSAAMAAGGLSLLRGRAEVRDDDGAVVVQAVLGEVGHVLGEGARGLHQALRALESDSPQQLSSTASGFMYSSSSPMMPFVAILGAFVGC